MVVESHATVHQMVTVVRGRLRAGADTIDCVRAALPAGSMTGAPKLRTLEIIDRLERRPPRVHSGALGILSVNGTADLSVVIRTLVTSRGGITIGAGGAIVATSEPHAELEEMVLEARALLQAVGGTLVSAGRLDGPRRERVRLTAPSAVASKAGSSVMPEPAFQNTGPCVPVPTAVVSVRPEEGSRSAAGLAADRPASAGRVAHFK